MESFTNNLSHTDKLVNTTIQITVSMEMQPVRTHWYVSIAQKEYIAESHNFSKHSFI